MKKCKNVDWHSATVDAIRIELSEYSDLLEYQIEYVLSGGAHRIDLLLIHKCSDTIIPKTICQNFREFNLFEIKGIHSSLTTDTYYKTMAYANLWICETGKSDEYSALDLTVNFISRKYPKKLFAHLQRDLKKKIEKFAPGVYDVIEETFSTRFLVTKELNPKEYLWLSSLTNDLSDADCINKLTDHYKKHAEDVHYQNYMNQLARANAKTKGVDSPMVLEGILELCGTSSEEIIARTKKQEAEYYEPLLKAKDDLLNEKDDLLTEKDSLISQLQAEIKRLKNNQKIS